MAVSNLLKVTFVTTGYPTSYRPNECIFVHRSIKALSGVILPNVIHLRSLRPGRPILEKHVWDGIDVLSVACPQLPLGSYSHFNTQLMEYFGKPLVRKTLNEADIIHSAEAYPAGFVSGKWSMLSNKPFSFNVIGSDLYLFLRKNYPAIGNQWLNKLKGVVCNSDALGRDLKHLLGDLPNIRTIYRGVDFDLFSPEGQRQGPQAFLPPVRFLYLGGFHTWDPRKEDLYGLKGGHKLLKAWEIVDGLDLPASLAIGGPGSFKEQISTWQARLRHPGQIFCINSVNPLDVPGFMRAADVVITPSLSEGLPNVARETQACARPVLGTNVGGIPEAVENGQTGLIVPPGDPKFLAEGIQWFCEHQDQIPVMGDNGRERMKRLFTWDRYKTGMDDFFRNIIAG